MRITNVATVEYLHEIEELIFGSDVTPLGPDVKYTEYNKIYSYKGKYFKAYNFLYKENGITLPDLNYFMPLELSDISTPFNRIEEIKDSNGLYLPNIAMAGDKNHLKSVSSPPLSTKVKKQNVYLDMYKLNNEPNKPIDKEYHTGNIVIKRDNTYYIDSNESTVLSDKYIPRFVTEDRSILSSINTGSGSLKIDYQTRYRKKIRRVKKTRVETTYEDAGDIGSKVITVVFPIFWFLAPLAYSKNKIEKTVEYEEDEEYDEAYTVKIWVNEKGEYIRDYIDGEVSGYPESIITEKDYSIPDLLHMPLPDIIKESDDRPPLLLPNQGRYIEAIDDIINNFFGGNNE